MAKDNGKKKDLLGDLFEKPKRSYKIPKPEQIFGKRDHGIRPQLVFYFDSEKDLKTVIRAFGGKKREPRTSRLIKMAKRYLKKKAMTAKKEE